jgi:hypothetical protein
MENMRNKEEISVLMMEKEERKCQEEALQKYIIEILEVKNRQEERIGRQEEREREKEVEVGELKERIVKYEKKLKMYEGFENKYYRSEENVKNVGI